MITSNKWYARSNRESDVVVSSRIRLARNVADLPFPRKMSAADRQELAARTERALEKGKFTGSLAFSRVDMGKLSEEQAAALVERHSVSPDFANDRAGKALFVSADESVGIMVGEEDHLRIQVLSANLDLNDCMELADRIDDLLDEEMHFAFDEKLGYLTQCPTNLGTGLRASVMLHLPVLEMTGAIGRLVGTVSKLGLALRGTFGEGSEARGALYQLSNQVTLGISEEAAIANLTGIASQLIEQERKARAAAGREPALADRVWRAYGVLRYCRSVSMDEYMQYMSLVRLGAGLGMFDGLSVTSLDALTCTVGAGNLMATAGKALTPGERDAERAARVRTALENA